LPFKIVTPFEAQRNAIEESLRASGLAWQDICHTVETIQGARKSLHYEQAIHCIIIIFFLPSFVGADSPYIVFTVAQTYSPGFLNDFGSTVTAITRFSEGMVVISNKRFLMEDPVATKSLLADMARVFTESDAWIDLTALTESTISIKRLFDGHEDWDVPPFDNRANGPSVSWGDTPMPDPTSNEVETFGWDESPGATWG